LKALFSLMPRASATSLRVRGLSDRSSSALLLSLADIHTDGGAWNRRFTKLRIYNREGVSIETYEED